MWIKINDGRLIDLEGFNEIYIFTCDKNKFQVKVSKIGDYLNSSCLALFDTRCEAEKYIAKLAEKLGAEEI